MTGIVEASLTAFWCAQRPSRPLQNYSRRLIVVLPLTFKGACRETANIVENKNLYEGTVEENYGRITEKKKKETLFVSKSK